MVSGSKVLQVMRYCNKLQFCNNLQHKKNYKVCFVTVRYCGQGFSLLWTPVLTPYVGPMH